MKQMFTKLNAYFALLLLAIMLPWAGNSQSCGTLFYDTGGPNGNYPNNEITTWTYCPNSPGEFVTMTFLEFQLETNWDRIYVHNGPDTSFPLIASTNGLGFGALPTNCGTQFGVGSWWSPTGTSGSPTAFLPGPFTSTHPSGCLTFRFCSDPSVVFPGWKAYASCAPPANCAPPVISLGTPVLNCATNTFSVQATVVSSSVPATTPILIASASVGGVSVPGAGGVVPNIPGSTLTINNIPLDAFTILRFDPFGFQCPAQYFIEQSSIFCPTVLDCGTPLGESHCYTNIDQTFFYYESENDEPIQMVFNSGLTETADIINVYNGANTSAPLLYSGNNFGNLSGLQFLANSGSLYMTITSNATGSCSNSTGNTSIWNWTIGCGLTISGCTDPTALNYAPVATVDDGDCIFSGSTCGDPQVVSTLPYVQTANTLIFGNNYLATSVPALAPGSFGTGSFSNLYLAGYDAVYEYTPSSNTFIDIELANTATNVGLWVFTGCPFASTLRWHLGTDANGRLISTLPVTAGETYYIVISTRVPPQISQYEITISETVFDCPVLFANIGGQCDLDGLEGSITENCECGPFNFPGCLNGPAAGSGTPLCTGAPITLTNARANEYATITVYQGVSYTFATTPNPNVPVWFITLATNVAMPVVLATGQNSITYVAPYTGTIRFYSHSSYDCVSGAVGSASLHNRIITANCSNITYDCPTFNAFIGNVCINPATNIGGTLNANCECVPLEGFNGCLTGTGFQTTTPNCTTLPVSNIANTWVGQFNNVNVTSGSTYTFSTTNNPIFIPGFYITISNNTGTTVLASGAGLVTWTANFTGGVRFYAHSSADCVNLIIGATTAHTRVITISCGPPVDCPLLGLNIGDPCNDGIPSTVNDTVNALCQCVGQVVVDCPLLGLNIGDACEDGNPNTINDLVNAACVCEGTLVEPTECGIYSRNPNAPLDINNPIILDPLFVVGTGETIESLKVSVVLNHAALGEVEIRLIAPDGTVVQLQSVICGSGQNMDVLFDDNGAALACNTGSDPVLQGTFAPFESLSSFTGIAFDGPWFIDIADNIPGANNGILVSWCLIPTFQTTVYDCPALQKNIGDSCDDLNATTENDTVNADCVCVGTPIITYDCPELELNIGNACTDNNSNTINDIVNEFCVCAGTPVEPTECGAYTSSPNAPIGTASPIILDPIFVNGTGGIIESLKVSVVMNHEALGEIEIRVIAPGGTVIQLQAGICGTGQNMDVLFDDNGSALSCNTGANPVLQGTFAPFEDLSTLTGVAFDGVWFIDIADNFPGLNDGVLVSWCLIPTFQTTVFDCPEIPANIGDSCDDGNSATINDIITSICECVGTSIYDCPDIEANIGDSCDDLNASTENDTVNANCVCVGTPIITYDCPELELNIGDACDDLNATTENDTVNADCVCVGTPIIVYDCPELEKNIGDSCDDGNPGTFGDIVSATCECAGFTGTACDEATFVGGMPTFAESEVPVSTAGAVPSGLAQCINPSNPQPDKWFKFTSIATVMYMRGWGLSDYNAAVEVYDACGGNLIACQNDAPAGEREIVILQNTVVGQTYYFRIYHGGGGTPSTTTFTAAVAHVPFTKLRVQDCGIFNYTPASIIASELPPNQFLLANWYFEFTELEAPFNTYEILSPNGSNPNFKLEWFPQAQYGRTYSVRTRPRMYQGPNWGDYSVACTIGFSATPLITQLIVAQANGFYNMCDILEADNVPGATKYRFRFDNGFVTHIHESDNRFCKLKDVPGLELGSPYAVRVRARTLGVWAPFGQWYLIAMNNFVVPTGVDQNITACGGTYPLSTVISAIEICAAEFYTFQFTNITDANQPPLFYTRDDGLRTIQLSWVTGLIPGNTYAVQVLGGSGGLVGTYGAACNITISGSGLIEAPSSGPESVSIAAELEVYPNPTAGEEVTLALSNLADYEQNVLVEIYDLFGKKVHSQLFGSNGASLNASLRFHQRLASGVYTVNVIVNEVPIGAKKLVVQ